MSRSPVRRRPRAAAILALLAALIATPLIAPLLFATPARGAEVIADLSSHIIAISSGFTGASVVLFGAADGPGDIIAVVRGPEREMTVWRKDRIAGIWINAESMTFTNVPSFYTVAASRPVYDILMPRTAALYHIGTDNLKLVPKGTQPPARARRFSDALIREQQSAGLFNNGIGKITFLGDRLFRASITFPSNVPTGTYLVQIYFVRNHEVVGAQTTPLIVSQVGVDAEISDFASRHSGIYGAVAVLTALMAGYLASLPFRRA